MLRKFAGFGGLLFPFVLIGLGSASHAQTNEPARIPVESRSAITMTQTGEYSYLGRHLEYWRDRSDAGQPAGAKLSTALRANDQFQVSRDDILNFGAAPGAVWTRFTIHNDNAEDTLRRWIVVENPRLWEIDVFELSHADVLANPSVDFESHARHRRFGNSLPFTKREVQAPPFYIGVELAPGATVTYYLRFWNRTTMQLPLALATDGARQRNETARKYMYGAFFGFFAALLLYNLLLFVTLLERNYLYYVLLLLFMGLFNSGYLALNFQFLIPDSPGLNYTSIPALGILCLVSVVLFTQDFLHTARHTPRLHRFLQIIGGVFLIALAFNFLGDAHTSAILATGFSLVLAIGMIYGAAHLWRRKRYEPARYYLVSWGIFYAALLVHGAIQFGLFTNGFLINHTLMIGASLATLLLSLGMAARIKTLDRARYALVTQLEVARDIQRALLPPPLSDRPEIQVGYLYEPMEAVGGDFIDLHIREDGRALFAIADVTGHGVPAALLSSMIKMALRVSYEVMEDPSLALARLHEAIKDKMAAHHITVCFCYLDLNTGEMRHASAGHLPPLIVRVDGTLEVLESRGVLLHAQLPPSSENIDTRLNPGDRIVMYTDGITETEHRGRGLFGEERLRNLVVELRELSPEDMVREVFQYARLFSGSDQAPLVDDFTLLAVEYRGSGGTSTFSGATA